MPLMKRATLLRLSGQMTSVWEGSEAERSVIMLSPSSFSRFCKKSTSPTYSVIIVKSLMNLSASTVNLQKKEKRKGQAQSAMGETRKCHFMLHMCLPF